MKAALILLLFPFSLMAQNYSSQEVEDFVNELAILTVDTNYRSLKDKKLKNQPYIEYWVSDNLTEHIVSKDPDYSDNEMYTVFQKIMKHGKTSDFILMGESKYPSIRVYGYWALVQKRKYRKAREILLKEKEYSDEVFWDTFGCVVEIVPVYDLMIHLVQPKKRKKIIPKEK